LISVLGPARKYERVKRTTSVLVPNHNIAAVGRKEFKLNGPASLLLHSDRTRPKPTPADKIVDPYFHDITLAQFAVCSEAEHWAVAQ
jgi:hypothetical protein